MAEKGMAEAQGLPYTLYKKITQNINNKTFIIILFSKPNYNPQLFYILTLF